jgi:uracil-DNA glycosylase
LNFLDHDRDGMILVELSDETDFDGWRNNARHCAARGIPSANIIWQVGSQAVDLFASTASTVVTDGDGFTVPRRFVDLARNVICHNDAERFALLYQLLFRLRNNSHALEDRSDTLVHQLDAMAKSVRRDIHKMRAFVRFRTIKRDGEDHYIAWFEPEHHIVRANAGFFMRRFATMRWSILTPELSIHWDGSTIFESSGATAADAPDEDGVEDQWKAYYASTFNPARLKVGAMMREMPKKYWKNMPETALVSGLIAGAQMRETKMIENGARPLVERDL